MFREKYPSAWIFHCHSNRTELNVLTSHYLNNLQDVYKEYLDVPTVLLPEVDLPNTAFSELLENRYSCRRFKNTPLTLSQLANILYAGYGLKKVFMLENIEFAERTIPSGGGMYPLEIYLMVMNVENLDPGIYHYVITPSMLEQVKKIELPTAYLQALFMQQPYVAEAQVIIVATAVVERSMKKYYDRGYRYILYEAGHCFQNMNLMATACGLGSLNIGGFFDLDLAQTLGIEMEEEIPLYAMAIGVPDGNAGTARTPR